MFVLQFQFTCECMAQTSMARKLRLCKSINKLSSVEKRKFFLHNTISYPAEPFNTAFQDDEVGRKTALTSSLDGEGERGWG